MSLDAWSYVVETIYVPASAPVRDAWAWAYETTYAPASDPVRSAFAYAYETTLTQGNPTKIFYWDGTVWVRLPWYEWTGTAWQQIV